MFRPTSPLPVLIPKYPGVAQVKSGEKADFPHTSEQGQVNGTVRASEGREEGQGKSCLPARQSWVNNWVFASLTKENEGLAPGGLELSGEK